MRTRAINSENKGPVQEGMVFTIEPGIYLPDGEEFESKIWFS